MSRKKVVIIGSGLGGLSCGVVLAKNGYEVTVLEQGAQIGGCLQCFSRRGAKFETGMHFIGSASEGQILDRLLNYLEVKKDIQLSQLDTGGYEVIGIEGQTFRFANGREAFIQQMASYFPKQHDNLERYFDLIEKVAGASSMHTLKHAETDMAINTTYQLHSINEVIDEIITDPLLAKVLVGDLPLYAGEKDKTPFATHAFITDFYNKSAHRIVGGSDVIANSLATTIKKYDGEVLTNQKVTKIICNDICATGVETAKGDYFPADIVISGIHPVRTLELTDSKLIRPVFRKRINAIPQTIGGFSIYLDFKENTVPYMNYNYFGYTNDTPWDCEKYDEQSWPKGYLYMHFCQEPLPKYAKTGIIISYMNIEDVAAWKGTQIGRRGEDYENFKQQKANKLIDAVQKQIPGLRNAIKHYYTSTPLTYYDYTGTVDGGMYGIARNIQLGAACRVPQRTKIPNVLQTGQNINSHGILGVIVGTIVTCSELLAAERIYQQITSTSNE